jgi:CheY-like chemotaxis protein
MNQIKPVLYADDDENDLFLMERAFSKLHLPIPLRTVSDGKQAIAYVSGKPPFSDRIANPLPCLVLLDLSMPGRTGLEVLKWIRTEASLSIVPVIILTSSNQQSDIERARSLGANGYFIKPGEPDDLVRLVEELHRYWLKEGHTPVTFTQVGIVASDGA